MLKAIIFDVDGVLVDSREANVAIYKKLFVLAGYPEPSREEILALFHMPLWQSIQKITGTTDDAEVDRIWNMAQDDRDSIQDISLFEFPDNLEVVLETLYGKYRLAIVTSRIRVGMNDVFRAKDLRHLFDEVVVYEDYDNPKPHPEPLHVALKRLKLTADEVVYIGDAHTDVEAARDAGVRIIHVAEEKHDDATAGIKELSELLDAIQDLADN